MKKIISFLVLTVLLTSLAVPGLVSAQGTPKECCVIGKTINLDDGNACGDGNIAAPDATAAATCGTGTLCGVENWGMYCLVNVVYSVTDWIFYLLMIFVVVMIVIGGAMYMMSAGDPEKAGKGKSIIIYGIIGLVIALIARLIPSVVKMIVGM